MRREIDILPTPIGVQLAGLIPDTAGRLRSALAVVVGIGFALFLLGLAYSPLASSSGSSRAPRRR